MQLDIRKYFGRRSKPNDFIDEELRSEKLEIASKPFGATTFNRKMVIGFAIFFGLVFIGAFFYGLEKSNHQTTSQKQELAKVQPANQGGHLANVPKTYDDKKSDKPLGNTPNNQANQIADLNQANSSANPAARRDYTPPSYTPIPQGIMDFTRSSAASQLPVQTQTMLSVEEQAKLNKAKEELEAKKSPIRFSISN